MSKDLNRIPEWNVYLVDELTLDPINETNVESNPTSKDFDFNLTDSFLPYNFYKCVFTFKLNLTNSCLTITDETFFKVVPSRLYINGLKNGIQNMSIGTAQKVMIDPMQYSFDIDNKIDISSLKFKFYCFFVNTNVTRNELLNRQDLNLDTNNSCFKSVNGYYFTNSGKTLNIEPNSLNYTQNYTNKFLISTFYGTNFYQFIDITIDPSQLIKPVAFLK